MHPFKIQLLVFSLSLLFISSLYSQQDTLIEKRSMQSYRVSSTAPIIDGNLEEAAWQGVEWSSDFIQFEPEPLAETPFKTQVKTLYDDRNLYIGVRCYDDEPELIEQRMSRRDNFPGDWIEINIDSYHDLRSAFSFTLSASGVKGDEFISNDGNNWDGSWNPIWYAKTAVDSLGWTAEMRIPLSQLRFNSKDEQVWGVQLTRRIFRKEQRDIWQPVSPNTPGWVSRFGELKGLKGLEAQKQLEIQPYILSQADFYAKEEGNPFATGSDWRTNVGLDAKIGVTNDLTLDLTINPDFGQVEADPGAVRLDGFQVFFQERRPFFIENRNIFNYRLTGSEAGGAYDSDILFYSRRIGGSPHRYIGDDDDYYVDQPANTTILGAAKFSGKTQSGLSVGILESITQREEATIDELGVRSEEVVEPFTNYFVGRVQQDLREGNTVIGAMLTSVERDIDDPALDFIHQSAYTGGIDFIHRWKDREWYIRGNTLLSRVSGSAEAILETQTAFEHLFGRTDADHLEIDSTATSLTGTAGNLMIGNSAGNWIFQAGTTWRSPELELNDIGFLNNADEINAFAWAARRWTQPFSVFRRFQWNYNAWSRWDFSGRHLYQAVNTNAHAFFKNFWRTGLGLNYELKDINNNALRGGPAIRRPNGAGMFWYLNSDERKKFTVNLNIFQGRATDAIVRVQNYSLGFNWQPTNALRLSVSPFYGIFSRKEQYVDQVDVDGQTVFLNGRVQQKTFSTTFRLNYNITPDLTIQYYGEPFVFKAEYDRFNKVTDQPLAKEFDDRFHLFSDQEITYDTADDEYSVDENMDGITDYSFSNPDFTYLQFRSNLVIRWEYIPGSELYLVWSQGANASGDPMDGIFTSLNDDLFSRQNIRNIFLIKGTYRFVR